MISPGIAGVILVFQPEIKSPKRDPATLSTPSDMNDPLLIWQHTLKLCAGLRSAFRFKMSNKIELP